MPTDSINWRSTLLISGLIKVTWYDDSDSAYCTPTTWLARVFLGNASLIPNTVSLVPWKSGCVTRLGSNVKYLLVGRVKTKCTFTRLIIPIHLFAQLSFDIGVGIFHKVISPLYIEPSVWIGLGVVEDQATDFHDMHGYFWEKPH